MRLAILWRGTSGWLSVDPVKLIRGKQQFKLFELEVEMPCVGHEFINIGNGVRRAPINHKVVDEVHMLV